MQADGLVSLVLCPLQEQFIKIFIPKIIGGHFVILVAIFRSCENFIPVLEVVLLSLSCRPPGLGRLYTAAKHFMTYSMKYISLI